MKINDDATTPRRLPTPQSVIVDTNDPDERYVIELFIGNMDDSADETEDLGLAAGRGDRDLPAKARA